MAITYAGVSLTSPTAEMAGWIARNITPRDLFCEWTRVMWPGRRVPNASWPWWQLERFPAVKPGSLWWPVGASRWAQAHFCISDSEKAEIDQAIFQSGYDSAPLSMTWIDMCDGEASVDVIEADMWMLPCRPLAQCNADFSDYWLLTLVDQRYWWWWNASADIVVDFDVTTWTDLYQAVGGALGVSITVDAIDPKYLKPPDCYTCHYDFLPHYLDAISYAVGQRIVVGRDGAVRARNASNSIVDYANNITLPSARSKQAGGFFDFPTELPAMVPSEAEVVFYRWQDGSPTAAPPRFWPVTTAIPNGNGETSEFHYGYPAKFTGANVTPDNQADLQGYVDQTAADLAIYQAAPIDLKYAGIVAWKPEGWTDNVEWSHNTDECNTRIQSAPFQDLVTEIARPLAEVAMYATAVDDPNYPDGTPAQPLHMNWTTIDYDPRGNFDPLLPLRLPIPNDGRYLVFMLGKFHMGTCGSPVVPNTFSFMDGLGNTVYVLDSSVKLIMKQNTVQIYEDARPFFCAIALAENGGDPQWLCYITWSYEITAAKDDYLEVDAVFGEAVANLSGNVVTDYVKAGYRKIDRSSPTQPNFPALH